MESTLKTAQEWAASELGIYVCPSCKHRLDQEQNALRCPTCCQTYPVREAVPDFILEELSQSKDPELRRMTAIDKMASVYETKLWYPVVLAVFGGLKGPSLAQLIGTMSRNIQSTSGRVLDIACGPGTFGRRVASPSREVYGIDVSEGMLRQGAAYAAQEGVAKVHFARARVEELPFEDGWFDAVLCCGSLHLFTDTAIALREMARVMKPAAILSVFTFTAGQAGILKFARVREWYRKNHGLHVFGLPEMEKYLTDSGFDEFQPAVSGSVLTFSARKAGP